MDWIWQSAWDFLASHFYVSPFWYWCFVGALVCTAAIALGWFFDALRSFAGAIVMAVIAGLIGYRRGETDAEEHAKAEAARAAKRVKRDQNPWQW